MLSLILYIFLLGFLVSTSVALTVSVPSSAVTAGQSGTVTWTRGLIDPLTFTLTLHDVTHNINGQANPVNSAGKSSGQVTFNFPDAGTFQIISSMNSGLISKTLSQSDQFSVNALAPPPSPIAPPASAAPPALPIPPLKASSSSQTETVSATSSEATSSTSTSTQASSTKIPATVSSQSSTSTSFLSSSLSSSDSQSFATAVQSSTTVSGYDTTASATATSGSTGSTMAGLAKSTTNTGAVIGGVLGALVFSVLLLAFCVCRKRRKQKTEFFRDMMVRRRSQALLFSQATVPSMGVLGTVADLGDPEKAGGYEQPLESASMTGRPYAGYAESFASSDAGPVPSSAGTRTSMSPVIFSPIATPSRSLDIQHATWTHRQIMIHDKVVDLQTKLLAKQSWSLTDTADDYDANDLKDRIVRLEQLMLSAWALGFTDERPEGLD